MRPQVVLDALKWLKTNNPFYSNIGVDIDNIDTNLTTLQQNENVSEQNPVLNTIGGMGNTTYNEPTLMVRTHHLIMKLWIMMLQ